MTHETDRAVRTTATIAASVLAVGLVALPVGASPADCANEEDPLDGVFCAIREGLAFDAFTLLDQARDVHDRTRAFGQQLNENNQQFYDDHQGYEGPNRPGMAEDYLHDQAGDVQEDGTTLSEQLTEDVGEVTTKADDEVAAAVAKVNEELAAAQAKAGDEVEGAEAEVEDTTEDAGAVEQIATDAAIEAGADAQQQVADQTRSDPGSPASQWRRNTEEDVDAFVSALAPSTTAQGGDCPTGA